MVRELIPLRRGESIFDERGLGTRRFNEYIEELTSTVNTSSSETQEISTQLAQNQQTVAQFYNILKKQHKSVLVTANYTAKPFDRVICNNIVSIDITLPSNSIIDDEINIKRRDAIVNVVGNIDGKTTKIINIKYYSMKLIYTGSEWSEM